MFSLFVEMMENEQRTLQVVIVEIMEMENIVCYPCLLK